MRNTDYRWWTKRDYPLWYTIQKLLCFAKGFALNPNPTYNNGSTETQMILLLHLNSYCSAIMPPYFCCTILKVFHPCFHNFPCSKCYILHCLGKGRRQLLRHVELLRCFQGKWDHSLGPVYSVMVNDLILKWMKQLWE